MCRAWDYYTQPCLVAPAMNTLMWTHPFTRQQIGTLLDLGVTVIPPVSKKLACGDIGLGT